MSDKFWHTADEWFQYAPCYGIPDFTIPPAGPGPCADEDLVQTICSSCTVRPECARAAYLESWNGVWSCGKWIPGHDEDKRESQAVRDSLFAAVEDELQRRGDDI